MLALLYAQGDADALATGGGVALFGSRDGTIEVPGTDIMLPIRALSSIRPDDVAGAHLVHLAYLTKDKVETVGEAAFRKTNSAIDEAVLAAISVATPASLFVASSGAASLAENGADRHPYGLAKLEQEARFLDWGKVSGTPVLSGRIFNLAGPYINKLTAYAVSDFAQQALAEKRIQIRATQPLFRSMLHVDDLCRLILRAARSAIGYSRPIDFCGWEVLEMQDIAALVAAAVNDAVAIDRPSLNFDTKSAYLGRPEDTLALAMRLGLGLRGAQVQVSDTVRWMRSESTHDQPVLYARTGDAEDRRVASGL
jgi:nucleoside-diphosphate-sugar epimerase